MFESYYRACLSSIGVEPNRFRLTNLASLFSSDRQQLKNVDVRSAKAEYDLAAELGLASKSQVVCRQRYSTCPFTADEMMKALRTANI